ncbi:hypothetical protein PLICRDRAFT_89594 [Plicaturopsis crispa FD-325 SS-3]|nr:hypothetical protein PLICRDRAFT_89594 [Plicaturopsis crispa FD-325 SS-3]
MHHILYPPYTLTLSTYPKSTNINIPLKHFHHHHLMDGVYFIDGSYCAICDLSFTSEAARAQHIAASAIHPFCRPCDRRFLNGNSLRSHYVLSARHHYCAVCERTFRSAAGLRMHIEYAAVHRDDSDDDSATDGDEPDEGWEDELGQMEFPDVIATVADLDNLEDFGDDWFDFELEEITLALDSSNITATTTMTAEGTSNSFDSATTLLELIDQSLVESSPSNSTLDVREEKTHISIGIQTTMATTAPLLYTCPVCLDPPASCSATLCGHVFCTECIYSLFKSDGLCPICRQPGDISDLRRLYSMP